MRRSKAPRCLSILINEYRQPGDAVNENLLTIVKWRRRSAGNGGGRPGYRPARLQRGMAAGRNHTRAKSFFGIIRWTRTVDRLLVLSSSACENNRARHRQRRHTRSSRVRNSGYSSQILAQSLVTRCCCFTIRSLPGSPRRGTIEPMRWAGLRCRSDPSLMLRGTPEPIGWLFSSRPES
jgi:hypothetical protein